MKRKAVEYFSDKENTEALANRNASLENDLINAKTMILQKGLELTSDASTEFIESLQDVFQCNVLGKKAHLIGSYNMIKWMMVLYLLRQSKKESK